MFKRFGRYSLAITAVVVLFLLATMFSIANFLTDWQWYASLGHLDVFKTRLISSYSLGIITFIATAIALLTTTLIAYRVAPGWKSENYTAQTQATYMDGNPVGQTIKSGKQALQEFGENIAPILKKLIVGVALIVAFITASSMAANWEVLRIALTNTNFGAVDPQFSKDIGFFVFQLPAINILAAWAESLIFAMLIFTGLVYLFSGGIKPWSAGEKFTPHVKAHTSVLLSLFVLIRALYAYLGILNLNYSTRGTTVGASYTDVHVLIPGLTVVVVICIILAILLLVNIKIKGWKLPLGALIVYGVAVLLAQGIIPAAVQSVLVAPNEAAFEKPYISRNIAMTRQAYGLTDVKGQTFKAIDNLSPNVVEENRDTFENIRLWDPIKAKACYDQLQAIRPYYNFKDVDVDRYEINGQTRQVLISAREMNIDQLAVTAQTWVNRHLVYTHGFGTVMNRTSAYDARGLPEFTVGDIPPAISADAKGSPTLEIKEPRIYFGEETYDYAVVNTGIEEFDHPEGEKNATTIYNADAGVRVGGLFNRILWSMRFSSSQMLFSQYINADSKILMERNVRDRITELAPWLELEKDIYSVIVDGRIVWVIDGYTHSSMYPYSERIENSSVNYLRGSVKATVDAYTGEVTFYAFDEEDPILQAWQEIFPELFKKKSEMPKTLVEHLRYPEGLFAAQADIYRTYHMTDPSVFYNKEDQWEIPGAKTGEPMPPFFVLLQLPGTEKEQFYLMQPYTPRNRDNMIGWMGVSSDPGEYGKRTVYLFPKERVILGPEQISARINQDPVISPQFSLWNQRGSKVTFGNMVVIPVKDSIVYVQTVFLQAEKTAIPELTAVVVAYGDKLVMNRNFEEALKEAFGSPPTGPNAPDAGQGGAPTGPGTSTEGTDTAPGGNLADRAAALYQDAIAAQQRGDWATYGTKLKELGAVLEAMKK